MQRTTGQAIRWILVLLMIAATGAAARADQREVKLRVADEQGQPVARFEVMLVAGGGAFTPWVSGQDGKATISAPEQMLAAKKVDVVVRADGFASNLQTFADGQQEQLLAGDATIKLSRGQKVTLAIQAADGMVWPEGFVPQVYFSNCQDTVRLLREELGEVKASADFKMMPLTMIEPGRYEMRLAQDSPPVNVRIHAPGFLRLFHAGPFDMSHVLDGSLNVALPKPAKLVARLDVGDATADSLPFDAASVNVMQLNPEARTLDTILMTQIDSTPLELKLNDLPAGTYVVLINTKPKGNPVLDPSKGHPGWFRANQQADLRSGEEKTMVMKYVPFDTAAFRGDYTAQLRITKTDGTVPAGKQVSILYQDANYGVQTVFSGTLPESGQLEVKELSARKSAAGRPGTQYTVRMDNELIGNFSFTKDSPSEDFIFKLPPMAGDIAPDIELTNIATGKTLRLSDLRGQVVCIDFWATWCGPCQEPMAHLDHLGIEKKEAWNGKVAIVPISIDDKMEIVPRHLNEREWTHLEHYWTDSGGVSGWKSPAPVAFGVNAVPTSLILDREGRIVWRGHPSANVNGMKLEDRVEQVAGQ